MNVLGLDPGMKNLGYAVMEVTKAGLVFICANVQTTEKSSKKQQVLSTEDNLRRTREISDNLSALVGLYEVRAICAESMSFPPSAGAAAKLAMCWGVIGALSAIKDLPVLQASPQQIKLALCGRKDASKEDIEAAVLKLFPEVESSLKSTAPSNRNHAYDAVASVITASSGELMRMMRSTL